MLNVGKIKLRDIKELQDEDVILPNNVLTPLRKRKNAKSASTSKKSKEQECDNKTVIDGAIAATTTSTKTSRKRLLKSALKETPSNQKRIDSYFTTCPKTYDIKFPIEQPSTSDGKSKRKAEKTKGVRNTSTNKKDIKSARRLRARRKRLFSDITENMPSGSSSVKATKNMGAVECITIDSDSDAENNIKEEIASTSEQADKVKDIPSPDALKVNESATDPSQISLKSSSPITASSLSFGLKFSKTSCASSNSTTATNSFSRRKPKPCPPYKVIENTSFAVDAFQFGYIENVTHYFLTHFHADHYIGLTKSFAMPLYMSVITARLVRKFIPVQEEYIHELELNQPCIVNDMEVTALDANHCPGAILIVFKFRDSEKCVLHTGDFRACHEMESESIFWDNHIHTIYLDTTYISDKYAFCTQYESIMKAQGLIEKFIEKHDGKRILYVCGSYIVGKEKFWSSLAETFELKVWAEGNRYKALKAMNEERYNQLLVTDPNEADMHVIPMGKISYLELVEYFKLYEHKYDILFAIRPSGWEKDSKPRYGNKINVIGIEYSEHSSYAEMQRFVKFLKPDQVISTVPRGKDYMKTAIVPTSWYKYDELKPSSNYQPSIQNFLSKRPQRNVYVRLPNINKGGVECFVSPLKAIASKEFNNNKDQSKALSIGTSKCAEINEKVEEFCNKNKKTSPTQNSSINVQINKNIARTKKKIRVISTSHSSEDFEETDLIIKTKNMPRKKNNLQEKAKTNNLTQIKPQCNKKRLAPKMTNVKLNAINSEEYFETPEEKLETTNKAIVNANGKADNLNRLHYSSEEETNQLLTQMPTPASRTLKEDLEISTSQKRITRSKSALTQSTKASSGSLTKTRQSKQHGKKLNPKSQLNSSSSTSQINLVYKSATNSTIDSTSNDDNDDEWQASDKSMEILISQKRITRSKSASTKTTNILSSSQNKIKKKFESKLLKIKQQIDKHNNTETKSTTNFNTSQINSIFKSGTGDSTNGPTPADEKQMKSLPDKVICFQNKLKKKFESKQIDKTNNTEIRSTTNCNTSEINPIFKSTTDDSTNDQTSADEMQIKSLHAKVIKPKSTTSSDNLLERFEYPSKPNRSKRQGASNHNLTPFKKTKPSLDTKAILNTILEKNEDIDRFNCSQLAGLVVKTVNDQNPDCSNDHIPPELLSDADDDWM